jgi:DNA-binding MarR family transcriptional regulator
MRAGLPARRVLFPPPMHFMSFAIKRTHLRIYATARAWHPRSPITAARYDILHVIQRHLAGYQAEICRVLHLSAATISRALARMEELGLLRRHISLSDRRKRWIQLTDLGLAEFNRVLHGTVSRGIVEKAYQCALGRPDDDDTWFRLEDSYSAARAIARYFGDLATQPYATGHPDE